MVDKSEKLREWACTSLLELSIKNLFSGFANAIFALFPWNKSNASTIRPPCCGGKEVSASENTVCCCCPRRLSDWKSSGEKKIFFFLKEKEKKEGGTWAGDCGNALQIGTALSTAFHGFLESIQRSISFVGDGLSFLLFKAIFESLWKLLSSFPDPQSVDTDCLLLENVYLLAGVACSGS